MTTKKKPTSEPQPNQEVFSQVEKKVCWAAEMAFLDQSLNTNTTLSSYQQQERTYGDQVYIFTEKLERIEKGTAQSVYIPADEAKLDDTNVSGNLPSIAFQSISPSILGLVPYSAGNSNMVCRRLFEQMLLKHATGYNFRETIRGRTDTQLQIAVNYIDHSHQTLKENVFDFL